MTLLPEWAGWLVNLDGVGMKAGVIRASTGGLDRLVADGVKAGRIGIPARRPAAWHGDAGRLPAFCVG